MNKTETSLEKISKKKARQMVYNKLADALVEFKPLIRKKKFDNKMLTATKLFAADIAKAINKDRLTTIKKNKYKSKAKIEESAVEQLIK